MNLIRQEYNLLKIIYDSKHDTDNWLKRLYHIKNKDKVLLSLYDYTLFKKI